MISAWPLILISIAYVGALFAIASWGDSEAGARFLRPLRPLIYALSLGVYCTSWTFFGAVGSAARTGWGYLPIYLGPALIMIFGFGLIRRIVTIARTQNLTSIADFLAARYGRGRTVAVMVTLFAVIGSVPYIALQLNAVTNGFAIVAGRLDGPGPNTVWLIAFLLAVFSIAFGTRRIHASEHNRGMVLAIAFESIVKLIAFVVIGLFAAVWLRDGSPAISQAVPSPFRTDTLPDAFLTQTMLAAIAMICLPRQFHVLAVEADQDTDVRPARWLLPLYLAGFAIFVVPLTHAGLALLPAQTFAPDTFVLALPMTQGSTALTLLAFLGGFSAATGMVIVASVALANMVSNEIALPALFYFRRRAAAASDDLSGFLITSRRLIIFLILLAALVYAQYVERGTALASLGLISFAAAAQFFPPVLAGLLWPGANRRGAQAGLTVGFALWLFTLFIPATFGHTGPVTRWLTEGVFGISALNPQFLFGDMGLSSLSQSVLVSLLSNTLVMVVVSRFTTRTADERAAAGIFAPGADSRIPLNELVGLAERFVGRGHAERAILDHAKKSGVPVSMSEPADRRSIRFVERLLAGAVGTPSARIILTAALKQRGMGIDDVVQLLDETSQAIQFNRQQLEATLANMSQGVSVIDASQRIIGWNASYLDMMNYPAEFLYVGKPVRELYEFNAARGHFGEESTDAEIEKRLSLLREGSDYQYESEFPDGRVIDIRGRTMPDGGYVTTFNDISRNKQIERALRESEARIRDYTDNVSAQICYIDSSRRILFCNAAFSTYLGSSREALIACLVSGLPDRALLHQHPERLDAALNGKQQFFEQYVSSDNDNSATFAITYTPDLSRGGEVRGCFATFDDISAERAAEKAATRATQLLETRVEERTRDLKQALERVQVAQQAADRAHASKTRFFAAAAHDLLQPVNAARLFTELMLDAKNNADSKEMATRVDASLVAVDELLNALLDISKLDAGTHQPDFQALAIQPMFDALELQFKTGCTERGLRIRFVRTHAWVMSDRALLRRILQNFISNAERYTISGGIAVGVRRRREGLAICVYDTGVGIPAEDQTLIFEEFQRLKRGRAQNARGMGLGLAITQRIARLLDHPINMRSIPGAGSVFEVVVPQAKASAVSGNHPVTATRNVHPASGIKSVLCVDNDRDIVDGMCALLTRWGLHASGITTGTQLASALAAFHKERGQNPDLLLVDYHLDDGETGFDVIEKAQALCAQPVHAVMITASRDADVLRAFQKRDLKYLHKPIKPAALRALINRL